MSNDPIKDTRIIMAGTVTTTKTKQAYLSGSRDSTTVFQGALAAYKGVRAAEVVAPPPVLEPLPTPAPVPAPTPAPAPTGSDRVYRIPPAGGGAVTSGMMTLRGTYQMAGTDTSTAFIRKPGEEWRPALLDHTMPVIPKVTTESVTDGGGCYCIGIADNGVAYCEWQGFLLRSDDAFQSRARIVLGPKRMHANAAVQRGWNSKFALVNDNPDVFVVGCKGAGDLGGAYYSLDGGRTPPVRIQGIADPFDREGTTTPLLVAVDPLDPKRWAIQSFGHGVYISNNGPAGPYALTAGSEKSVCHMHFDAFGRLWTVRFAADQIGVTDQELKVYENGAWRAEKTGPGHPFQAIAVNPLEKRQIFAVGPNGSVRKTFPDAAGVWQWGGDEYNHWPTAQPYRADTLGMAYSDTGDQPHKGLFPNIVYSDTIVANRFHAHHGIGTCYTEPPLKYGGVTWTDTSPGIYQICSNYGHSYIGGGQTLCGWDKGMWPADDFATMGKVHSPEYTPFTHAWHMDHSPSRRVEVALCNAWQSSPPQQSGYRVDKGAWQRFEAHPDLLLGGSIGAFSDDAFLIVPQSNKPAVYTLDRGKSWQPVVLPNGAVNGTDGGWGYAHYFKAERIIASKETPGRGWLFNMTHGVFRTDNGPAGPWVRVAPAPLAGLAFMMVHHFVAKEVPGHANFLLASGGSAPEHGEPLLSSRDGGITWNPLPLATLPAGVQDFSFGKPLAGAKYPVLRMEASIGGVIGIYEITDLDNPVARLVVRVPAGVVTDRVRAVSGDMNVYGKWAYGYGGSGWVGSTLA